MSELYSDIVFCNQNSNIDVFSQSKKKIEAKEIHSQSNFLSRTHQELTPSTAVDSTPTSKALMNVERT